MQTAAIFMDAFQIGVLLTLLEERRNLLHKQLMEDESKIPNVQKVNISLNEIEHELFSALKRLTM